MLARIGDVSSEDRLLVGHEDVAPQGDVLRPRQRDLILVREGEDVVLRDDVVGHVAMETAQAAIDEIAGDEQVARLLVRVDAPAHSGEPVDVVDEVAADDRPVNLPAEVDAPAVIERRHAAADVVALDDGVDGPGSPEVAAEANAGVADVVD